MNDDYKNALNFFRKAGVLYKKIGDRVSYAYTLWSMGTTYKMLGEFENAAENHYWGSISRIGRALTDTKDKTIIENKMLEIIADNTLDDYNRVLIYYLFFNYNNYLTDEQEQLNNNKKLRLAIAQMPAYLSSKIEVKDEK
jgi:hypothetical protein